MHKGAVTRETPGHVFSLGVGDAVTFSGDVAHSYTNAGKTTARFSLAVFEPGVGATPVEGA